ncbi:glutamate synthase large subunit [Aliikangiella coralliicola]|uniref:Glutamate synthase [NADPH] large chain n=1 Tax=Aliikangiella coralliicola TaxID=2592383 RepID=A0A545UAE3_9GAMM|nr:glutamate synthase large subunit [Aliikangiella coralliicola]TQV86383.1 glutamate synthase large subunit [Aliikangiella coralliicola]
MTLYKASQAKDNCGFGLIAQLDGLQSHQLIDTAITALTRMTHRGAVHADGKTGDGCGLSIQLGEKFFRKVGESLGFTLGERFAVGQVFLNKDQNKAKISRRILEEELAKETLTVCGWRKVPIDTSVCGENALNTLPEIEQVFISAPPGWGAYDLERRLFMARRRAADRIDDEEYYVVSLSNLMIVYKGLVIPKYLGQFFPDLADPDMKSAICLFHQRFSTNTAPLWKYAQPFRYLAHNGEINTISANRRWAVARQKKLYTPLLPDLGNLKQLVNQTGSDSSSLDNMLEILLAGGMDIFRALRLLVPPAWANRSNMDPDLKAFYEFNSMHTEPWDGPAGIVMSNGVQIACTLDRNGLRPARYVITKDRVLTVASEVGVWDYNEEDVIEKDRVGPGEMLAADISTGQIWRTNKIDDMLKTRHPYLEWLRENTIRLRSNPWLEKQGAQKYIDKNLQNLPRFEKFFNVSVEEKEQIIQVMANQSQEASGSMGDDTPIAVLSQKSRSLFDYFRQQFAQVTNPPIDPLREKSVMSLETCFGREHNVFQETNGLASRAIISKPILNYAKLEQLKDLDQNYYQHQLLSLNYDETESLENAIQSLCDKAVELVKQGCVILRLSDRDIAPGKLVIHAALATGAVHSRLIVEGLRCDTNIIVETATTRDPHHFAVLLGVGATAIYPYLALQIINNLHTESRLDFDLISARRNYFKGINKGLLKIMSKMGISTIASYRGAQLFEAVGLDQKVIDLCFPSMYSRIDGATFEDIQRDSLLTARRAWQNSKKTKLSGQLKYVHGGEYHCYNPDVVQKLQQAVNSGKYSEYQEYANQVNNRPVAALRDLMKLKVSQNPLAEQKVESKQNIMRRFDSAGMSVGALSPEAHEALAMAMNRIGGRSNSGEGGEDPVRYQSDKNSKIKQIASGRFGVTARYLANAEVLQIKIAQGAKPGEGGQLPGSKVTMEIARLRNSTPGVTLISPPPHHDIYSIEDIAQLIFDLKQVNPKALISVKLVSGPGVGTIAAGVAKAYADMITIAGHDGGTGASPLTSVKYAGTPWELGLSEAHQALVENGLRDRICLQVDGGLKTGLDVIKGAILGADSFGFGTGPMVALGCKFLRICHLNNCATGVATQNKTLRSEHFTGLPERVINYFEFIAQETREWLAKLGVSSLDELIGRTDLLEIAEGRTTKQNHLNLQVILDSAKRPENGAAHYQRIRNVPFDKGELNQKIINDFNEQINLPFDQLQDVNLTYPIKNYDRSVGAALAGQLALEQNRYKRINLNFKGIAGQSFGVWNSTGMHLRLTGDANDYVGKGMSGGSISIFPQENIQYVASRGAIIGNTCLYGASGGSLFAAGQAGERFAVRNSGADAVVEGLGDHGCEYMTGGTVVVLGPVGENFAAGMTGGLALVLDLRETLSKRTNFEHVELMPLVEPECESYQTQLIELIDNHIENTGSPWAKKIRQNLPHYLHYFMVVVPKTTGHIAVEVAPLRIVQ